VAVTNVSAAMKKYVALFGVSYISIIAAACFTVYFIAPKNPPTCINTIAILLSVTLVGFLFARKHKRTLTAVEYRILVISAVLIDAVIQSLPFLLIDTPLAHPILPGFALVMGGHALLFAVGFSSRVLQRYVLVGT
jgi:hypothetical protein